VVRSGCPLSLGGDLFVSDLRVKGISAPLLVSPPSGKACKVPSIETAAGTMIVVEVAPDSSHGVIVTF
jgi:hypothetical protein